MDKKSPLEKVHSCMRCYRPGDSKRPFPGSDPFKTNIDKLETWQPWEAAKGFYPVECSEFSTLRWSYWFYLIGHPSSLGAMFLFKTC